MKLSSTISKTLLLLALVSSFMTGRAAEFDQQHARYAKVLSEFVKDSRVNYAALKAKPGDLIAYLDAVAAVPESEFKKWNRNDQLALLLNLYNAQTFALVIDNYPLKSIRDIGVLPLAAWKKKIVRLWGKTTTLSALENDIIRTEYPEQPGIHFALVCGAKSCPPLRGEPYVGARLTAQLADQGRQFLADQNKNRVDAAAKVVYLSKIFDWYEGDFKRSAGSATAFVQKLFPAGTPNLTGFKVQYTDYDWSLNEQGK